MSDVNRGQLIVSLRDVHGNIISDEVEFKIYNQTVSSLNQLVQAKFKGQAIMIDDVPAFPTGLAELFIKPKRYRYKSIFINVFADKPYIVDEMLFIEPDKARASFTSFADIKTKAELAALAQLLTDSKITQAVWDKFDKRQKATLFNLHAKMAQDQVKSKPMISYVERIALELLDAKKPERIYATVSDALLDGLRKQLDVYEPVNGSMHNFPSGWERIDKKGSFKSRDAAGNIQLTFAQNDKQALLADIDLDDHSGVQHAADVLKHKITGKDTDPFNIHEILVAFQPALIPFLDAGYTLS